MGVDYSACAIIGVEIDPDLLWTEETVPAFQHNYPPTMKFDPQTGKPLWRTAREPVEGYDDYNKKLQTPEGVFDVAEDGYESTDRVFVGFVHTANTGSNGGPTVSFASLPVKMEETRQRLKQGLQAMFGDDVWVPTKFGLYAILKAS